MNSKVLFLLFFVLINISPIMAQVDPPSPGGVPIDGGLGALLIAGGALGYKAYKKRKEDI